MLGHPLTSLPAFSSRGLTVRRKAIEKHGIGVKAATKGAEEREEAGPEAWHQAGNSPTAAGQEAQPVCLSKRLYKLRWRIENPFSSLERL